MLARKKKTAKICQRKAANAVGQWVHKKTLFWVLQTKKKANQFGWPANFFGWLGSKFMLVVFFNNDQIFSIFQQKTLLQKKKNCQLVLLASQFFLFAQKPSFLKSRFKNKNCQKVPTVANIGYSLRRGDENLYQ